jgi:endonuclease III
MNRFDRLIALLRRRYGQPAHPPAKGPFELVLWENACYLLPDERRLEVFNALRDKVGLDPASIDAASDGVLLPIAMRGGMRPEMRVFRWREISRITLNQFAGDLNSILSKPYPEARKSLKQFPTIGDPGAEKILLLCGVANGLPLESNGLRVLSRVGWGRNQKNYAATYRSVQDDVKPELPAGVKRLQEAHLLLRTHGQTLCKDKAPLCHECPVSAECDYSRRT